MCCIDTVTKSKAIKWNHRKSGLFAQTRLAASPGLDYKGGIREFVTFNFGVFYMACQVFIRTGIVPACMSVYHVGA